MMGVVALSLLLVPAAPAPPGALASGVQAGLAQAKVDTVPLNQFASPSHRHWRIWFRDLLCSDSVTQKES